MSYDDLLMATYELREKMVADRHRPRYHFVPPEGRWNDLNGMLYWKGRYHVGYLQKIGNAPGERDFSSWQHVSSRDLVHWRYHPASLREPLAGTKGDYFNSGDAMEGMEVPTIIANMPRRGICIYQAVDDDLDRWVPLAENPVIALDPGERGERKLSSEFPECVIFDPSGWKEGDTYYALVGNKNFRPGYEGDCTSLFKSRDLAHWQYVGPFYRSQRRWTAEEEDCACSDFFPFGDRHMLLMHTHRPYGKCQYYIGRYEDERFVPERNGQLSWLGSMLAGPETLADDRGRRIFMGWISRRPRLAGDRLDRRGDPAVAPLPRPRWRPEDRAGRGAGGAALRRGTGRRPAAGSRRRGDRGCALIRLHGGPDDAGPGGRRRVRHQAAVLTGRRGGDDRHLPRRRRRVRDRLLQVQHRHLAPVSARRHPAGRALPAAGRTAPSTWTSSWTAR